MANIPGNLQSIGTYAFYNTNITAASIPDSVVTIGDDAFNVGYWHSKLRQVYFYSEEQHNY